MHPLLENLKNIIKSFTVEQLKTVQSPVRKDEINYLYRLCIDNSNVYWLQFSGNLVADKIYDPKIPSVFESKEVALEHFVQSEWDSFLKEKIITLLDDTKKVTNEKKGCIKILIDDSDIVKDYRFDYKPRT